MVKIIKFFLEVKAELKKVSWTPLQELRDTSFVVLAGILLLALYIGTVDFLLTQLLGVIIK